jgi:hypothetical protein
VRRIYRVSLLIPASWGISQQQWRFFLEAVGLPHRHEDYESDNKKVKCDLKEDHAVDGGSSHLFGCGGCDWGEFM